jgi:hypothetical protein
MLLWDGALYPWSFGGYGGPVAPGPSAEGTVLTPRSIVAALGAGYRPATHPSLGAHLSS